MVFSSNFFIFAAAPLFFLAYFTIPDRFKNAFTLLFSIAFYTFGTGQNVYVLLVSVVLNYYGAFYIDGVADGVRRTLVFTVSVALNLAFLVYYKYAGFLWDLANDVSNGFAQRISTRPRIDLPIGISFFTFQAVSYLADVYGRHTRAERSMINFAMYHTLFPQLIAGPIVRYAEIRTEVAKRSVSVEDAVAGISRFVVGLAKKVIIADSAGSIADAVFQTPPLNLSFVAAWVGVVAYTVQIFFDFSGYSDMAIGLGRLLGFHFPENFNGPYVSQNVTEFWRRWHMTLSRWFRDYLYIPLGGNKRGPLATYRNLLLVFLLCGLWHGAAYTFVAWGLFHGALLVGERALRNVTGIIPSGVAGRIYALLMIMVGWTIFRATNLEQAPSMLGRMTFMSSGSVFWSPDARVLLAPEHAFYLLAGIMMAVFPAWELKVLRWDRADLAIRRVAVGGLFLWSAAIMSSGTFHPFIYFRF